MASTIDRNNVISITRRLNQMAFGLAAERLSSSSAWTNSLLVDQEIQKEADVLTRRSLCQVGASNHQIELFMRGAVEELSSPENFDLVVSAFETLKKWRDEKRAKDAQRELSNQFKSNHDRRSDI
jgi:hypothetical protein